MATYGHDEKNNRIETMTKEEIYALLDEAIQEGQLPSVDTPTAFVTMIKSIVDGNPYKIGFCTQAQYNELEAQGALEANAYYVITDDETYDDIVEYIDSVYTDTQDLQGQITVINQRLDDLGFKSGSFTVTSLASITTTTNTLTKQGKYVIANLDIKVAPNQGTQTITLNVPSDFLPKENTSVALLAKSTALNFTFLYSNAAATITTSGQIEFTDDDNGYEYLIINAAWELN